MSLKINKLLILFFLIILQSCSGGRIGKFFESSFKNIEETEIKEETKNILKNKKDITLKKNIEKNQNIEETEIKEETKNILKNKKDITLKKNIEKNQNIEETEIKEETKNILKNKKDSTSKEKLIKSEKYTNDNKLIKTRKYKPQSYKIILILKEVDPKDPIENLSFILGNSDVNFEIEKIERFIDSNNKSIKRN